MAEKVLRQRLIGVMLCAKSSAAKRTIGNNRRYCRIYRIDLGKDTEIEKTKFVTIRQLSDSSRIIQVILPLLSSSKAVDGRSSEGSHGTTLGHVRAQKRHIRPDQVCVAHVFGRS